MNAIKLYPYSFQLLKKISMLPIYTNPHIVNDIKKYINIFLESIKSNNFVFFNTYLTSNIFSCNVITFALFCQHLNLSTNIINIISIINTY